jgi:hypothetical protein
LTQKLGCLGVHNNLYSGGRRLRIDINGLQIAVEIAALEDASICGDTFLPTRIDIALDR